MELLRPGDDYFKTVISSLDNAAANGYIIALMNERVLAAGSGSRHEIKRALNYDRKNGGKSILAFTTTKGLVDSVDGDEELRPLKEYGISDISEIPSISQCDEVVNQVLIKMLTPGAILTHAHNLKNGVNCNVDLEEAEKLYSLYFNLADKATDKGSDTAWRALGRCYEMGWGTSVDLSKALECYRDSMGFSGDIQRVISIIRGDNHVQTDKSETTRTQSLFRKILKIFTSVRDKKCSIKVGNLANIL